MDTCLLVLRVRADSGSEGRTPSSRNWATEAAGQEIRHGDQVVGTQRACCKMEIGAQLISSLKHTWFLRGSFELGDEHLLTHLEFQQSLMVIQTLWF